MSFEEELSRHLRARGASLRFAPDVDDLRRRLGARHRRAKRYEHLSLAAAVILLAAALGGLAGALSSSPRSKPSTSLQTRYQQGSATPPRHPSAPEGSQRLLPATARTLINRQLPDGLSVAATEQGFAAPVEITSAWGAPTECATGEIVSTTVGKGGAFGGGISVAGVPALRPGGLEILSSGVLQLAGGGEEWWVTAAVGAGVTGVAAENLGGSVVTVRPDAGVAVVAGPVSGSGAGGEMSAVAEGRSGAESLAFLLGSGPRAIGVLEAPPEGRGCAVVSPPAGPASASSSQPADPGLAAASIIAAFTQADAANPLLGFAANLAAVSDGNRLSAVASSRPNTLHTNGASPLGNASSSGTEVKQVTFLSGSTAEVVYGAPGGVLYTGRAELGTDGIWRVSLATFCDSLRSGLVGGEVPSGVAAACLSAG